MHESQRSSEYIPAGKREKTEINKEDESQNMVRENQKHTCEHTNENCSFHKGVGEQCCGTRNQGLVAPTD